MNRPIIFIEKKTGSDWTNQNRVDKFDKPFDLRRPIDYLFIPSFSVRNNLNILV